MESVYCELQIDCKGGSDRCHLNTMQSWEDNRPKNYYADCVGRPRPCPWVGCKYHLLLDVNEETGTITLNVGRETSRNGSRGRPVTLKRRARTIPGRKMKRERSDLKLEFGVRKLFDEFRAMVEGNGRECCVLDAVVNEKHHTLEEVGDALGVTRERIRQIESTGIKKLHEAAERDEHDEWIEMK